MDWLWFVYAAIGVGVYMILAKAIERRTGQAPRIGCFMWFIAVVLWPVWVVMILISYRRMKQAKKL
jgi:hypothetical protein